MKKLIIPIIVCLAMTSCKVEPEPLVYGEDACHACKMTLMDRKFGAELVTSKGKIFKFDDVNCMMNFFNAEAANGSEFTHRLVVDFAKPGKLIPAADAFYLKSPQIKSPMASQIAAFSSKEELESVQRELSGVYLVWGELITQFK